MVAFRQYTLSCQVKSNPCSCREHLMLDQRFVTPENLIDAGIGPSKLCFRDENRVMLFMIFRHKHEHIPVIVNPFESDLIFYQDDHEIPIINNYAIGISVHYQNPSSIFN